MQTTEKLHPEAIGLDEKSDLEILNILYEGQIEAARSVNKSMASLAAGAKAMANAVLMGCLLYTSPSPRDRSLSRMPSSA